MCATIIKGMAFQKATELFIVHVEGKKEKYVTQYHSHFYHYVNVMYYYLLKKKGPIHS
jgi:hypothetical protein